MNIIKKSELIYEYNWKLFNEGDPKITGELDRTRFNRNEGYEVIYLINKLAKSWAFEGLTTAHKMEKMIKDELPLNIYHQSAIATWISKNW